MKEFRGTYLGLTPTDESNSGGGEIEVVIDNKYFKTREATGLTIMASETPISEFKLLSKEEFRSILTASEEDKDKVINSVTAFKRIPEFPKYLFFYKNEKGDLLLWIIRGDLGDSLGPTILFSSPMVARGEFDKLVARAEADYGKGSIARLRNNGKPEDEK
ncbi:MAG: hypothetical protein Q7S73_01725 [bacterium]|nr:hypothetical protein [bacterium]